MSTEGVRRWLSEFKTLTEAEWTTYAFGIRQDEGLEQELQDAFEGDLSAEAIDPICHQLFDFYRSMNVELQRFTLNLLPTLITSYLTSLTSKDKRFGGIEACLLGIYNLSVIGADGKPKVSDVTIPTLACSSIYHEPPSLASLVLTESALLRHHSDRPTVITVGPLAPIHCMNSQNRLPVLTHVISCYNANITCMSTSSHQMLGKMCSRLAKTGFEGLRELSSYSSSGEREVQVKRGVSFAEELRIPLSSDFLLELLTSLYYIMFKNDPKCAITALEDIHTRASYDLLPEVLLVTNAIRNSIRVGGSADDLVGRTMGISVAVSPSRANPIFSKDAITNASFKARKLPEDIDVPEGSLPEETSKDRGDSDTGFVYPTASERPKVTPQKATKGPMKSIMKKRDEKSREKSSKGKDAEGATRQSVPSSRDTSFEMHPMKSPRHSTSSAPNGEIVSHGVRVVFEPMDGPATAKSETSKSETNAFLNLSAERPAIVVEDEDSEEDTGIIPLNGAFSSSIGGRVLVGESNMQN